MTSINKHLHLRIANLLLLLLVALFFSPIESHSVHVSDLCESVCQKSTNYASCIKTIAADPQLAKAGDVKTLAILAMEKAKKQSATLTKMFDEMEKKNGGGGDPKFQEALKLCSKDFKDANFFFNPQEMGPIFESEDIHSALDYYQNCKRLLKRNGDFDKVGPELRKWRHFYTIASGAILKGEADFRAKSGDLLAGGSVAGGGSASAPASGGSNVDSGSASAPSSGGATGSSGSTGGTAGGSAPMGSISSMIDPGVRSFFDSSSGGGSSIDVGSGSGGASSSSGSGGASSGGGGGSAGTGGGIGLPPSDLP
ncbi:unnamed protein product [Linum trigynum]|uniref:Pectinesterase inhibitor domain-containing protein n=1 Tax=Linum trigynum TaxID=586398 RepID=A0AAV2DQZ6_9ROSI